jgi:hypothetical protein
MVSESNVKPELFILVAGAEAIKLFTTEKTAGRVLS